MLGIEERSGTGREEQVTGTKKVRTTPEENQAEASQIEAEY